MGEIYTNPPQSRNEALVRAIIDGTEYTDPPQSRNEAILKSIIDGTEYTADPQSRMEDLLLELKETIAGDGKTTLIEDEGDITFTEDIGTASVNHNLGIKPQFFELEIPNYSDIISDLPNLSIFYKRYFQLENVNLTNIIMTDIAYKSSSGGATYHSNSTANTPTKTNMTLSNNYTGGALWKAGYTYHYKCFAGIDIVKEEKV